MSETIFPDGLSVFEPNAKAPEFIKATIYINPPKFYEWARLNKKYLSEKGYLKFNIKKSQKGTLYIDLDTWKPDNPQSAPNQNVQTQKQPDGSDYPMDDNGAVEAIQDGTHAFIEPEDNFDDIPFD